MNIEQKYIPILEEMLQELYENQLVVCLVPCKYGYERDGGTVRAVCSENVGWYKDLCLMYPSSRKRKNRAFDTKVKRKYIFSVLERMIKNGSSNSNYAKDLMEIAKDRYNTYEELRKANEIPWDNQF